LRLGVVLAGLVLLAAGLSAAQSPGREENPFDAAKKADAKPAPQPAKKAAGDPLDAAVDSVDPFADRKPDVRPTAKRPGPPGARKTAAPTARPPRAAAEPGAAEAAIEKALAETVEEFTFDQTPLTDVIDQLHKQYKINILLDGRALEGMSIDSSTEQVTLSLSGVSLRSALNLMLGGKGLTYTIHNEVLYITTPDEAQTILVTRVYEVADLVRCRDEKDVVWYDYDPLIDAIENVSDWEYCGGGTVRTRGLMACGDFGGAHVLILSTTLEYHEKIAKLLEEIRKIAAKAGSDQKPPMRQRPKPKPDESTRHPRATSPRPGMGPGMM
jgi:hypothetical protein